jgi:hypothetical protein
MENNELEKTKAHILAEINECPSDSFIIRSTIKKATGNIGTATGDNKEELNNGVTLFNSFVQLIDVETEIMIDGKPHLFITGQSFILPDETSNIISVNKSSIIVSSMVTS